MSFVKKSNINQEPTFPSVDTGDPNFSHKISGFRTGAKEDFLNLGLVWDWQWEESDLHHCCFFPSSTGMEPPNLS